MMDWIIIGRSIQIILGLVGVYCIVKLVTVFQEIGITKDCIKLLKDEERSLLTGFSKKEKKHGN